MIIFEHFHLRKNKNTVKSLKEGKISKLGKIVKK